MFLSIIFHSHHTNTTKALHVCPGKGHFDPLIYDKCDEAV